MKLLAVFCIFVAVASADFEFKNVIPMEQVFPIPPHLRHLIPKGDGSRIVGGEEAKPHQFPHQAAIYLQLPQGVAFCGGSIISKNYILTAAHCVDGVSNFTIILGAHKVQEQESTQVRDQVTSANAKVHSGWDAKLLVNDIAVIKLSKPVTLNDNIQTIGLPPKSQESESFEGRTATISGWGKPSDSATGISPVLRYVNRPVITNTVCNRYYLGNIKDTHICTSGADGKATCNGDSGGPLYVENNKRREQIGIVSFGIALGCEVGWPSAYTRTTSYLGWIAENTDVKLN